MNEKTGPKQFKYVALSQIPLCVCAQLGDQLISSPTVLRCSQRLCQVMSAGGCERALAPWPSDPRSWSGQISVCCRGATSRQPSPPPPQAHTHTHTRITTTTSQPNTAHSNCGRKGEWQLELTKVVTSLHFDMDTLHSRQSFV